MYNQATVMVCMRFDELNWFDVEHYLKTDDRLILILGACEQHGYLSLLSDVKIPAALADAASQKTGVLVAPPINFGASPYFISYPGTISLRITTMMDMVEDVIRSVYGYGFRRILCLNGHGGNEAIKSRIYEVTNTLNDIRISWYSWWSSHSVQSVSQKYNLRSYHGGWIEAFPFTRVANLPPGDKTPPRIPGLIDATTARQLYGDGVFGGPYQVDQEILHEIFLTALADILQLLQFE
jgi:creatinine amidohydrolase